MSEIKKARTDNSTYPKGGVSCSKESFVVNGSLVFQIKFCGKSPALWVVAIRWRSVYKDSQPYIQAHLVLPTHKADTETKRA
jgi:hypothetical protein